MQCTTRVVTIALLAAGAALAQVSLSGRVVDEDGAPLARARISVHQAGESAQTAETGPTGTFRLDLPGAGKYLVTVQRTGFFLLSEHPIDLDRTGQDMTLVLNPNREINPRPQRLELGAGTRPRHG